MKADCVADSIDTNTSPSPQGGKLKERERAEGRNNQKTSAESQSHRTLSAESCHRGGSENQSCKSLDCADYMSSFTTFSSFTTSSSHSCYGVRHLIAPPHNSIFGDLIDWTRAE